MFTKKSSRHSLALFVALALGSGALLAPSAASAADVNGNDVVIDDTHAPSDNVVDAANHIRGTAAGFVKDTADSRNVKDNKLTLRNFTYANQVFGGFTWGTGHVTGNKIFAQALSVAHGIFGGATDGGGNAENNHVFFEGTRSNGDLTGGLTTKSASTQPSENGRGVAKKNTVTLKTGQIHGSVLGGMSSGGSDGDVIENTVTIAGGQVDQDVYGGLAEGNGNVRGNTVTITGGIMENVYGGKANGAGEVTGNTVNLGDGKGTIPTGYAINGTIFGGKNTTDPNKVSNNTLNVNTNAKAYNIKNFSTINFNFSTHTDTNQSLLTLTDTNKTKLDSLSQLYVKNAKVGKGTLMWNSNGIEVTDSTKVGRTEETTETIIEKNSNNKAINYRTYQFKGSTTTDFEGTNIWGGRSTLGNTTTGNKVTVSDNYSGKYAYGGWTKGSGSTATGEKTQKHSIDNEITLEGTASEVYHMTGGSTDVAGGKATGNHAVLDGGRVTGNLAGGRAHDGEVSGNIVDIKNGGRVDGTTHGGITGGTGKAENNTVTLTGGTLSGDIFGGSAANGDAIKNTININGGSAANHDVYGGWSTNGNATGNTVNITGGSIRNVDGGRSLNGHATNNIVNIGSAEAGFSGSITGKINGGSGTGFGKDYVTGNKLNLYGNVSATNINHFAEINFHFNSHVNQSTSFLTLNDSGDTFIKSLSGIQLHGDYAQKGTLIKNASGTISLVEGDARLVKTDGNKEFTLAKSADSKRIDYEGYAFAHQTAPTTVTEGGTTNTWGGRSIGGNSTRHNKLTIGSGTHTNIYGGWTAGSGTTAEDKDNSYKNEVTLDGATTGNLYGGYTDNAAGKAEKNIVTVKSGTVSTDLYGGIANKTTGTGHVKENIVKISGGTINNVYGGYSAGSGEVSGNKVTATGGTGFNDVRGGYSTSGAAKGNKVRLGAVSTGAVTGGHGATVADGNEVTLTGTTVTGDVTGGGGATTNNNIVNLNGGTNVTGTITGGSAGGTGNTLNVKGANSAANITGFQKLRFDTDTAMGTPMLTLSTAGAALTLASIEANGAATENPTTLLHNAAGLNVADAHQPKSTMNAEGTRETNLDVRKTSTLTTDIVRYAYTFKGARTPVSVTEGGVTNTWGGRSKAGNTTTDNKITVASGTHTNVYGGWTAGSGTTAAADKQNDSSNNTVTVTGGTVANLYGGYTEAATGQTTGNTVNIGDGEHTLASGTSLGTLSGGNKDATDNTLNVRANATASQIENFSNITFEFNHVINRSSTLLNLMNMTGTTLASLNLLNVSGTPNGSGTLIQNSNGVTISDGRNTRTKTGDTTEATFQAHSDKVTYEGYTFKGVKGEHAETTDGANTWGGRSKLGNTTTENEIVVSAHNHTNIYGGWTNGAGSEAAADKQKDSIANKVTVKGSATAAGNVIGGLTEVAGGKATGNTVTVEKDLAANIIGGKATGEASGNTINLANATVNSVTGGEGAATNNNIVNLNGNANVTGTLKGGSQASGTGNTLNVKGKNNKAGSIENIQKMNFDATGLAKDDTMLEDTNATGTTVNWTTLTASGTATKPLTLLKNTNGIKLAGYTGAAKSETDDTTETNIDVRKTGGKVTEITYEGYQFKGVTQATTDGDTFGGISKAGNSTRENEINVESGIHANVYGGWTTGSGTTAADKDNSYKNKVKVSGSANVTGTVYGGFSDAAGGKATANEVTVTGGTVHDVVGGEAKGEASGNTVTVSANAGVVTGGKSAGEASNNTVNLANATVSSVTGGEGAATNDNTVNLNGGANVTGVLKGGSAANGTGNTLNVKGVNSVDSVTGFQQMNFDATGAPTDAALLRTTGATDVNWETLTVKNGVASEKPLTLLENANGINISGRTGDAARSELNTDATMETNIDVRQSGSKVTAITYEGYTFRGAAKATTYGADTWAGRSKAGNTTQDNKLTLSDASKTYANVYGGWTSGTGTKAVADKQNNSLNNTVDYTAGTVTGTLYGGYAANGEASGNTVNLGTVTTAAHIYGGFGAVTKNNTINLKGARVTGTVTGGSQANGTGNTLAVYKPSEVHDFAGIQNLHFYTDEMATGAATPMLKLGTATKDIRGLNIGVARSGTAPKLNKGDKILLMKTAGGALTTDAAIQNKVEGMQGVSRRYEYEIKQEATGELTATVTKAGFAEQAKSLVETRAGLAGFVNQGADYLVQDGLAAAQMSVSASTSDKGKNAQRKAAASDGAAYQLWAGAGANSMRAESGSYVDSKGWNLGVGWAREDVQKDGAKVLFSPFVEYGRGTYDSYLDDGTHGSGKVSYIGAGVLGKLTQNDGLWLEGSLRAGRSKSDYSANLSGTAASYDGSNTYYGAHLGAGKTFAIKEDSSIDAYARYFWSHQNSMTATLNTGDVYEFGSVNSQRLRLGLRYSLKDKTTGEFYAGLAWEHEFAGKADATYQGDAAPSPSLKGSSTMLELGYRFMPKNSRVSYDLHLNGWQGKRKGITGGASVKWAF